MTRDQIKSVLDRVLTWSLEEQERAAETLLLMEASRGEFYHPDDEEWTAIEEGLADVERGDVATDVEMAAVWKRFGA
jgi:predicted transcriptional regulator